MEAEEIESEKVREEKKKSEENQENWKLWGRRGSERSALVVYGVGASPDPALAHPVGIEHGRRGGPGPGSGRRRALLLQRIEPCGWQDVWTAAWRQNAEASDGESLLRCRGQENERDDNGQPVVLSIHPHSPFS